MHVVIFEGSQWGRFAPLSLSRPVFMLATGTSTLLEKQIRHLKPSRLTLWVRPEFADIARQRIVPKLPVPTQVNVPLDDEPAMLVRGRTLHFRAVEKPRSEMVVLDEADVIRKAYVRAPGLSVEDSLNRSDRWMKLRDLPKGEPQSRLVEHLWDLVQWNEESLIEDFASLKTRSAPPPKGAYHLIDAENIWLGADVKLAPGVVLDATQGPVMIDHHATIGANSIITGPCYLGPYVQVNPLSYIRPGTSIGMMCKVGGEISNSILFGYSNKQHYGYLGDSYIGKWVNLGAGTVTSNLKNTYGEISASVHGEQVKTGRRYLGATIGDHVKTAVGTRLTAGSYVGFSSMLAGSSFAPKYVPSYCFWTDKGAEYYRFEKALQVVRTVFARRDRSVDALDEAIMRYAAKAAPELESIGLQNFA